MTDKMVKKYQDYLFTRGISVGLNVLNLYIVLMVSPKITLFRFNATSSGYFAHLIGLNKNIRDSPQTLQQQYSVNSTTSTLTKHLVSVSTSLALAMASPTWKPDKVENPWFSGTTGWTVTSLIIWALGKLKLFR